MIQPIVRSLTAFFNANANMNISSHKYPEGIKYFSMNNSVNMCEYENRTHERNSCIKKTFVNSVFFDFFQEEKLH